MIYLQLFFEFFKAGLFAIGGGLATIPFLTDIGQRTGWFTSGELANMIAISESTPGPMGVNMATYVGFHTGGIAGGVIATLGLVFPSLIIITLIAAFLSSFADSPLVQHALGGINACVVALIAVSVLKLGKSTLKNAPAVCIFLAVLALAEVGSLLPLDPASPVGAALGFLSSPAILVVLAGVTGWLLSLLRPGKEGGEAR